MVMLCVVQYEIIQTFIYAIVQLFYNVEKSASAKLRRAPLLIMKTTLHSPIKTKPTLMKFILVSSLFCVISLCVSVLLLAKTKVIMNSLYSPQHDVSRSDQTTVDHLVFGIASTGTLWPWRKQYTKLWWNSIPNITMRGCVFVDALPHEENVNNDDSLPPLCVSQDTSQFPYTYKTGHRSAIRVARVVKETVALNHSGVRWYVFGDDDTIFFPHNLLKTLSKYDHRLWYYVGSNTEMYEGNKVFGFGMAFGGGGFAISSSLAQVLAKVLDSCIQRYPHLLASDSRVYSCITELGVGLTHEPGFHQVTIRLKGYIELYIEMINIVGDFLSFIVLLITPLFM